MKKIVLVGRSEAGKTTLTQALRGDKIVYHKTQYVNNFDVIIVQFKNLRAIREDNDIKQKDIAKYLNVSQNTYSQYETGVISLTAEILIKLADYYDVSIDYLLDRTDNPSMK